MLTLITFTDSFLNQNNIWGRDTDSGLQTQKFPVPIISIADYPAGIKDLLPLHSLFHPLTRY